MARILFGPLVSAVKGSISGVTFQNNTSGTIARNRPRPSKSSTVKQSQSHAALQNLLYQWQNITQDQREQWNQFAAAWPKENKFGESKTLTGMNYFTSVNFWRLELSLSLLESPPAHTTPLAPPSFEIVYSGSDMYLFLNEPFDFTNNSLIFWSSLPTKRNTISINQIRKQVAILDNTFTSGQDMTTEWETCMGFSWDFSANFVNSNIFYALQSISRSSGITSSMLITKNTVPAEATESLYYY